MVEKITNITAGILTDAPTATAASPTPASTVPLSSAPADEDAKIKALLKYKELLDMGILTQEEFEAKKKQLLG